MTNCANGGGTKRRLRTVSRSHLQMSKWTPNIDSKSSANGVTLHVAIRGSGNGLRPLATQHHEKNSTTRKSDGNNDEMRSEYDLSKLRAGTKGKYYERAAAGNNLVLIEPDLRYAFPDSKAVNDALRVLVNATKGQVRQAAPRGHSATKSIRSTSARQSPTKKARPNG